MDHTTPKRHVFTSAADARIEFAAAAEGKADSVGTLTGYALVWNVLSSDRGGYKVRLLPNSAEFERQTFALYHHEFKDVLGSTLNNTLRIMPDEYGVKVEIDLPDTSTGRDVAALVRRGDVRGMSFAMTDTPTSHTTEEGGETIVNAESYMVDEVTITPIPAFTATTIAEKVEPDPEQLAEKKIVETFAGTQDRNAEMSKLREHKLSLYRL